MLHEGRIVAYYTQAFRKPINTKPIINTMRRFTLLVMLFSLFAGGAWAIDANVQTSIQTRYKFRITSVNGDVNRGYLIYSTVNGKSREDAPTLATTYETDANKTSITYPQSITEAGVHSEWALAECRGSYYLYNVEKEAFIAPDGALMKFCTETLAPAAFTTEDKTHSSGNKTSTGIAILLGGKYLAHSPGYTLSNGGVRAQSSFQDHGNVFAIEVLSEQVDDALNASMQAQLRVYKMKESIAEAEATLNLEGVGYPIADAQARKVLGEAVTTAKSVLETGTVAETDLTSIINAVTAYKSSTVDIQLPEHGRAYKIKAVYGNGAVDYLYKNSAGKLQHSKASDITDPNSMVFVCHKMEDGKFVFANYMGSYLKYTLAATGDMPATYDAGTRWIVQSAGKPENGTNYTQYVDGDFFGRLELYDVSYQKVLLPSESSGEFHNDHTVSRYYAVGEAERQHSYTFVFEEVENPRNKIAPTQLSTNCYVATFSAPYPTVLPEGVKAYAITGENGGLATTVALSEGVIPAGTGVLLDAESDDPVYMAPACDEAVATVPAGNLLQATGATGVDGVAGMYILANGGSGIGFYPVKEGTTIGSYRAYLQLASNAKMLTINFDNLETGINSIEGTENGAENDAIYDLSGRRVSKTRKGIYIVNGKMVIN